MAWALAALGRRFHSVAGLRAKLAGKGFSGEAISHVEGRLCELGYLDDQRHGRSWAEGRIRVRGEGPARVRAGLVRLGVPADTAAEIVTSVFAENPPEGLAEAEVDRWCRIRGVDLATAGTADLRRLAHHISRRGFSEALLWRVIRNRRR